MSVWLGDLVRPWSTLVLRGSKCERTTWVRGRTWWYPEWSCRDPRPVGSRRPSGPASPETEDHTGLRYGPWRLATKIEQGHDPPDITRVPKTFVVDGSRRRWGRGTDAVSRCPKNLLRGTIGVDRTGRLDGVLTLTTPCGLWYSSWHGGCRRGRRLCGVTTWTVSRKGLFRSEVSDLIYGLRSLYVCVPSSW